MKVRNTFSSTETTILFSPENEADRQAMSILAIIPGTELVRRVVDGEKRTCLLFTKAETPEDNTPTLFEGAPTE